MSPAAFVALGLAPVAIAVLLLEEVPVNERAKAAFSLLCVVSIAAWVACTIELPTIVVNNTTSTNVGGAPMGSATPTPATSAVAFIRVGFVGGTCPPGYEVRNGQPLQVGCVARATATPLGIGDAKLGPEVHGYECRWSVDNPAVAQLVAVGDNPFNVDVRALAPGTARVTATVQGRTGSLDVVVTSGKAVASETEVTPMTSMRLTGWYSADDRWPQ